MKDCSWSQSTLNLSPPSPLSTRTMAALILSTNTLFSRNIEGGSKQGFWTSPAQEEATKVGPKFATLMVYTSSKQLRPGPPD